MVVYNKTKVDTDIMMKSLIKSTRKTQLPRLILSIIVLLCGIPFVIVGHINNASDYLTVGYLFLAIAIVYFLIAIKAISNSSKNVSQKNKDILENGITYDYQFKEQSFIVNATTLNKTTKLPYKYDVINKVYEYEDRFEFKLKENQVLFINKSGFESNKHIEFFIKNLSKNKKKIINKVKTQG